MITCTANVAGEDYADFVYRHGNSAPDTLKEILGNDCFSYVNEEFVIFHVPLADIPPVTPENYPYNSIPTLYGLLDDTSMEASGILQASRRPALGADGAGTIIGFIDTGIDYQNPLFRNRDGSTRILGIWDQTAAGPPFICEGPRGIPYWFLYGREYREEEINRALKSDRPLDLIPVTDTIGHGTFLAGIAAGGETESSGFTGAAPAAYLGIVKLKPAKQYLRSYYQIRENAAAFQDTDIMMGTTYLLQLAYRHRLPLVICIGLGSNQGGHDGSSPLEQVQNRLQIFPGVSTVCAAGNEAGRRHHYSGHITGDYDEAELRVGENETGFDIELWASLPEVYTVGFVSPSGEVIGRIPLRAGQDTSVRFSGEESIVTVSYVTITGGQSSYLAFIRFRSPSPGIWKIRVYPTLTITGIFHMWLPIHGFITEDTYFLRADPYTTVTAPGTALFPITAAAYNHLNGSLYIHSSRGYTRDGRLKPDLAAPGVDVFGPGISSAQNTYPMTRMTGSSVAAAHTAGAAAALYSWGYGKSNDPYINNSVVKAYLTRGAQRNPNYTYPSREWGYGTLDLYEALISLRN